MLFQSQFGRTPGGLNMKKGNEKSPVKPQLPVERKSADITVPGLNTLIKYFQILNENDEPVYQILDMFPIPIEIFAPDGTTVYHNRASLEMVNCKNPSLHVGKYNLLKDKICMDQLGYRDDFLKAFKGEMIIVKGFPAPIQDLMDRKIINEKPFEAATMDLYFYPIWKDEKLIFVVCVFVVRNLYIGRPDVAKARKYIDSHWKEEFDFHAVAKHVNMGVTQLYGLFHKHTGMTPGDYYRSCKVEHIKEKLADKNLSVKEAFAACGEDSRGAYSKVFKKLTGFSPSEYRKGLN